VFNGLMSVHPTVMAQKAAFPVEYGLWTCHQPCPSRVNFEAQSGDNLPSCNFLGALAKDVNFESKVGHCTAVN
jgi:hypothetical protein